MVALPDSHPTIIVALQRWLCDHCIQRLYRIEGETNGWSSLINLPLSALFYLLILLCYCHRATVVERLYEIKGEIDGWNSPLYILLSALSYSLISSCYCCKATIVKQPW